MILRTFLLAVTLAFMACDAGTTVTSPPSQPTDSQPTQPTGPTNPPTDSQPSTPVVTGYVARSVVINDTTWRYKVFVPAAYTASKAWPLILFLHGSGERGTDNNAQTTVGLGPVVTAQAATFPAIVVFPQFPVTPENSTTMTTADVLNQEYAIADSAVARTLAAYNVDPNRVYITGVSAGGYRAWEMAFRRPGEFAAVVPISAGLCANCMTGSKTASLDSLNAVVAHRLSTMPAWVFHGSADNNSPVAEDRALVAAFEAVGAPIRYTEYANGPHNIWTLAYAEPTLWTWLWAQHR